MDLLVIHSMSEYEKIIIKLNKNLSTKQLQMLGQLEMLQS